MDDIEMAKKNGTKGGKYVDIEEMETDYRPVNWKRFFFRPKYIPIHLLIILAGVATVWITLNEEMVVEKLRPFSEKVRDIPAGFLIPVGVLILISFPPLFGHEIVAVLCGVIYGLWPGFAIVAAGTFFGEIGTWFAFKYALRRKAIKLEKTNLNYGALARLTREGGFWIVLVIRLSIIPSHFSTAVFSTCDVKFWHFALATFLSLPKQIILVYLGVLLVSQNNDNMVKTIIVIISFLITVVMAVYIYLKMRKIKAILLQEQAERKAEMQAFSGDEASIHQQHNAPVNQPMRW